MNNIDKKVCSQCGIEYPATLEFFHKKGDKLHSKCKVCRKKDKREYLNNNKENNKKKIDFFISENAKKIFDKKAEEFNMNRVEFMKLVMLKGEKEALIKIDPKCFDNFNNQIMGIATNINQIAHVCNTTRSVNEIDVENLRNEFKKIREWQRKLEEEFKQLDTSIKYTNKILTFDDI